MNEKNNFFEEMENINKEISEKKTSRSQMKMDIFDLREKMRILKCKVVSEHPHLKSVLFND